MTAPTEITREPVALLGDVVDPAATMCWFQVPALCEKISILSENAKCYGSKAFTDLCDAKNIDQSFTRPYTPRTNGKAERFIQTMKRRWAYKHIFRTSAVRAASLRPWVKHYNHQRPHREIGKKPPMARLMDARQQAA